MADQDGPNPNANKDKAEGERWSAEQFSSRNSKHDENPEQDYPAGKKDNTGGITNRPMTEEVENQKNLPDRGTHKDETANPGSTRREGDYSEDR